MTSGTLVCTNKGCGQSYNESLNSMDACHYHPGPPIFHEGLKGWTCCTKRVTEFDEFLAIPGCAVGSHVVEIPVEEKKENKTPVVETKAEVTKAPPQTEVFKTQDVPVFVKSSKETVEEKREIVIDEDPDDVVIQSGAPCKRGGCGYSFKDNETSRGTGAESKCVFHPGVPVFHEGSKGWNCCTRRVLEFDEFLAITGCKTGNHCFIGSDLEAVKKSKFAECRHDWYQSPTSLTLSIYSKGIDPKNLQVDFQDQHLKVEFICADGKTYILDTDLFQPIVPSECKFKALKTKVEIVLKKANGISWASLEPNDKITSWTTFGTTGRTGTVGGKEMFLSNDSPILAVNR